MEKQKDIQQLKKKQFACMPRDYHLVNKTLAVCRDEVKRVKKPLQSEKQMPLSLTAGMVACLRAIATG